MSNRTRTYLLVEGRLGKSLSRHVGAARARGCSWNAIAMDLHKRTDVAVTAETLRLWFVAEERERTRRDLDASA